MGRHSCSRRFTEKCWLPVLHFSAACLVLGGSSSAVAAPSAPAPPQVSASFDIRAVVRQVRLAYRPAGESFVGGHGTYGVTASKGGKVTITPYHHPWAAKENKQRGKSTRKVHRRKKPMMGSSLRGAPLYLETQSVKRGGGEISAAVRAPQVKKDGTLAFNRGGFTEHLRNSQGGVEQSWTFAKRPQGSGDLVVRIMVSGQRYLGRTAQGLHFSDPQTGLGFRYGQALWVSAEGGRTKVQGAYRSGMITLRVPSALINTSRYPAVLDPLITPEFGVDKPTAGSLFRYGWIIPNLAGGGGQYLVVWADTRRWDKPYGYSTSGKVTIYGARISASGALLDPTGFLIAEEGSSPRVAFGDNTYLVVWDGDSHSSSILGARVNPGGVILDKNPIQISSTIQDGHAPSVTFGGGQFFVVWEHMGADVDIHGARVAPSGTVLDKKGILLSTAQRNQNLPRVASDGKDYFAVWEDLRSSRHPLGPRVHTYGTRISHAGKVLDPQGIAISSSIPMSHSFQAFEPSVAFGGGTYLIVWQQVSGSYSSLSEIAGRRVSSAGKFLDPGEIVITMGLGFSPDVAYTDKNFLVVWMDRRNRYGKASYPSDIYGARVSPGGLVLDTAGIPITKSPNALYKPKVATGGSSFSVVWTDMGEEYSPIEYKSGVYSARINRDGKVLDVPAILVSRSANSQWIPGIAKGGKNYLVVWIDGRIGAPGIYGAMINSQGKMLDASGVYIERGSQYERIPEIASDGSDYLVVWENKGEVYGARISAMGKSLDSKPINIAKNSKESKWNPIVAFGGGSYLVIWNSFIRNTTGYGNDNQHIHGTLLNKSGIELSPGGFVVTKSVSTYFRQSLSIAYGGGTFFVAWETYESCCSGKHPCYRRRISGTRITEKGSRLDSADIQIAWPKCSSTRTNQPMDATNPSVAYNGETFLVIWSDSLCSGYPKETCRSTIHGRQFAPTGPVSSTPEFLIHQGKWSCDSPAVTSDGNRYLVAWEDWRNGTSNADIYGARVTPEGYILDLMGVPISDSLENEFAPALVSTGPKSYMVMYSRFDPDNKVSAYRIRGRAISWNSTWPDIGSLQDGGAKVKGDVGASSHDASPSKRGCGCQLGSDDVSGAVLLILLVGYLSRRRRRPSTRR